MTLQVRQAPSGKNTFYVNGSTGQEYMVVEKRDPANDKDRWMCTCLDFIMRRFELNENCKHIDQVLDYIKFQKEPTLLQVQTYLRNVRDNRRTCPFCVLGAVVLPFGPNSSLYKCQSCRRAWRDIFTLTGVKAV